MKILEYLEAHWSQITTALTTFYITVFHAGGLRQLWANFMGPKQSAEAPKKEEGSK